MVRAFQVVVTVALLSACHDRDRDGAGKEVEQANSLKAAGITRPADSSNSKSEDPCEYAFEEMALNRTWTKNNLSYGEFEIRLAVMFPEPTVIEGWQREDGFEAHYPRARFQFRDANGMWQERIGIAGSFVGPPDTLLVSHEKRSRIYVAS